MSSLYVKIINALYAGSKRGGGGGEGKHKAVGFQQGSWVNGTFAIMKEGLPSQVSGILF